MNRLKYFVLIGNLIFTLASYSEILKQTNNKNEIFERIENTNETNLDNKIQWHILESNYDNNLDRKIQWEVLPENDYSIKDLIDQNKNFKNQLKRNNFQNIYEISPIIPTNHFIKRNNLESKVEWKSSFGGGKSGGTGQQNNSFRIIYGLNDITQLTAYFAEADDDTYNFINGQRSQYSWQTYALSLKRKIFNFQNSQSSISFVSSLEYFKISSGSENTKSIFNEINDSIDKDKFGKILYSFSIPFTKKINQKLDYILVPGFISLPNKLGNRTTRNNYYGNNFYLANGITYKLFEDLTLIGSYTNSLGPGNNYFNKNINFMKKPIYNIGLNWDINNRIGIETKLTNGFGSTPSTGLLTLPSENSPLYYANIKYNPRGEDTYLKPLNERDKLISYGGITVNNALLPKFGSRQYSLNFDSKGNYFGTYSHSLSNIFQLEIINIGSYQNVSKNNYLSRNLKSTYFNSNNFHIRLGGKFLLFSPQKDDSVWTAFRTSVGRDEDTNQGYIFSELINTYRINNWLAANLSSKFFLSGSERASGIGSSLYINLLDELQIIPEMNITLNNKSKLNNTLSIRYKLSKNKTADLYISNAVGVQDIGSIIKDKDYRYGLKLNIIY
tara:strand:- start:142 stop:1983 length:1842 start_codon:yes stop_codon:yes gene_type:complete